jgi:hypothetical protein
LIVTTFRVAALTWGAVFLTSLGLASGWVGVAYAAGFLVPFSWMLTVSRVGRSAHQRSPADPGLESMLARRALLRTLSALILAGVGAGLIFVALRDERARAFGPPRGPSRPPAEAVPAETQQAEASDTL